MNKGKKNNNYRESLFPQSRLKIAEIEELFEKGYF